MEKGLAVFIALVTIGLLSSALSWAAGRIDAWMIRTPSKAAPLVVGLGVWGSVLVGVVVVFIVAIRRLP